MQLTYEVDVLQWLIAKSHVVAKDSTQKEYTAIVY